MRRELRAIPEAPLHLSDRHTPGNFGRTLDYIPGTALRGALATAYLQRPDLQQEVATQLHGTGLTFQDYFHWLFLSECVRFPNLYPMRRGRPLVIPLTARSCKRFPGFFGEDVPVLERPHGVCDVLLHGHDELRCGARLGESVCAAPMERFGGFYESSHGLATVARRVSASRRVLTRTAIEPETEAVRHGSLYSLDALEEGGGESNIFVGDIVIHSAENGSTAHAQPQEQLLLRHLAGPLSQVHVGGAKTRGLGALQLQVSEGDTPPVMLPLETRLDRLQDVWQRRTHPIRGNQLIFTLTLNSDAILLDDLWRYRSVLDRERVMGETDDAPPFRLECFFTDTRVVSGWNSAHRLPKEDELAITRGAAFLYTTSSDRATLLKWLERLEDGAIGERRSEGFGHVIACHPFHWEVPQ